MRRGGFTLLEIICAVVLVGVVTTISLATFNAVSRGWEISTDYIDKMQRTDYALNQVVASLRSMYYPNDDQQSYDYGFTLEHNGDGENPKESDVIEWSRLADLGNKNKNSSTIHRVQLMVLEEGDDRFGRHNEIDKTGLYLRRGPDVAIMPANSTTSNFSLGNEELYAPALVADGIVGFNCRVLPEPPTPSGTSARNEKDKFEDTWDLSNAVPYKVELTFHIADPDGKSYRSNTAPVVRIVRIPMYEQSKDGAALPGAAAQNPGAGSSSKGGRKR